MKTSVLSGSFKVLRFDSSEYQYMRTRIKLHHQMCVGNGIFVSALDTLKLTLVRISCFSLASMLWRFCAIGCYLRLEPNAPRVNSFVLFASHIALDSRRTPSFDNSVVHSNYPKNPSWAHLCWFKMVVPDPQTWTLVGEASFTVAILEILK